MFSTMTAIPNMCFLFLFLVFPLLSASFVSQEASLARPSGAQFQKNANNQWQTLRVATQLVGEGGGDAECDQEMTADERDFIENALLQNVMFTNLPRSSLNSLLGAFEGTVRVQNETIVKQGDSAQVNNYVYLLAEGKLEVLRDGKVVPEPYGTLKPNAIIGELGVLYNSTRAATVTVKSETAKLFQINGDTFKKILNSRIADDIEELKTIDDAIQQVEGTKSLYDGDIIQQFKPERSWLWRRWKGTILEHSLVPTLLNMLFSLVFMLVMRRLTDPSWNIGLAPDKSHPIIARLSIVHKIWTYQMSLTTFILTFFLNQAYSFWQDVYHTARGIQGSLNDFSMLCATAAKRKPDGTYTSQSKALLDYIAASSRLFHTLMWASVAKRFQVLRTPRGLEQMASRGLMTSKQLHVLNNIDVPENQKQNAPLQWMMIRALDGLEDGTLRGDSSLSSELLQRFCALRGTSGSIGSKLSCRMPLAYAHFVQILVDSFILIAPLALYPDMGAWSVIGVGLLTLFYTGLLDLAKIFLDPLDNESYTKSAIYMDLGVLIRESNAGSTRWKNSAARLP